MQYIYTMQPKVKVNVVSEPSDVSVSYDAIVEASNAMQEEPQLLDNYDTLAPQELLGCNPSEHDTRHDSATYDAIVEASNVKQEEEEPQLLDNYGGCRDVSVKKDRPKRTPKKKVVAV